MINRSMANWEPFNSQLEHLITLSYILLYIDLLVQQTTIDLSLKPSTIY